MKYKKRPLAKAFSPPLPYWGAITIVPPATLYVRDYVNTHDLQNRSKLAFYDDVVRNRQKKVGLLLL